MTMILLENGVHMPVSFPPISSEEFAEFCRRNPDLQAERTADGELVIMSPTESLGDSRNAEITIELGIWNRRLPDPGIVFGPSAGFTLPSGAVRLPDAAWISGLYWRSLPKARQTGFAHVCPEFVLELMSPSDRLDETQGKMVECIANGARLAWLIDPKTRLVHIYRPNQNVQLLANPVEMSGDPELPGFLLPMNLVF